MVVEVGFTVNVPDGEDVLKEPGVMVMDPIVPVAFHERVLVPAEATTAGEAENEEIIGVDVVRSNSKASVSALLSNANLSRAGRYAK